jgi:hypothetical protein
MRYVLVERMCLCAGPYRITDDILARCIGHQASFRAGNFSSASTAPTLPPLIW